LRLGSRKLKTTTSRKRLAKPIKQQWRKVPMERFFNQQNVERYHKMLANPRDEVQRRIILKLLAEEEGKLKERVSQTDKIA